MRIDPSRSTGKEIGGGSRCAQPARVCASQGIAIVDLVLALREIAAMPCEAYEARRMRQAALAGLKSASRWITLPETP